MFCSEKSELEHRERFKFSVALCNSTFGFAILKHKTANFVLKAPLRNEKQISVSRKNVILKLKRSVLYLTFWQLIVFPEQEG